MSRVYGTGRSRYGRRAWLGLGVLLVLAWVVLATQGAGAGQAEERAFAQTYGYSAATVDDPALPRVLLIGDSISIGYTVEVRRILAGQANVHRIATNGGPTQQGLKDLQAWLGAGPWDVIHFNWGIWDTHVFADGRIRTGLDEYKANLNRLVDVLESTGAQLIWATTTPYRTRQHGDLLIREEDNVRYMKAGQEVMAARGVMIDDLYEAVRPRLGELLGEDDVHFTREGYRFLGGVAAASISKALETVSAKGGDHKGRRLHAAVQPGPRNGEKWWVQRQARIEERLKEGNVDAVFIGDSITEAWEHYNGRGVWQTYYEDRQVVNLGFGGDQTQHAIWRLERGSFEKVSPKVAVVMIGTNNISAGHSVEQIVDGTLAIFNRIQAQMPRAKIVAHGVFPRGQAAADGGRIKAAAVNAALAKIAEGYDFIEMLDLSGLFLNPDGTARPAAMASDYVHLSDLGYQVWAEGIEDRMAALLGDERVRLPSVCAEEQAAAQAVEALGGFALVDKSGHVTTVDLSRNGKIDADHFAAVSAFSRLKVLDCQSSSVTDDCLKHVEGLKTLELLNVSSSQVTDEGLKHLRNLESLEWLGISTPHIVGDGLVYIKGLKHLRLLTLWGSSATDAVYEHLKGMTWLEELFLGGTKVGGETIEKLRKDLPSCAIL